MTEQSEARSAAHNALDQVREAHAKIRETIEAKSQEIEACKQRITELARAGTIPADEALAELDQALDGYVERGRRKLDSWIAERCRPNHGADAVHIHASARSSIGGLLGVTQYPNGRVSDPGEVLAAMFADQIKDALTSRVKAACEQPTVPAQDERLAEIARESERLEQLETEHDALLDEQAELFGTAPSERTRRARKEAEQREHLEALNAAD